jgi:aminodeoxyfutalosine deaminase
MNSLINVRASWIWDGHGVPIPNGQMQISIPKAIASRYQWLQSLIEFENHCLIPGLINGHTHLEFSDIEAPIPATGRFTDWLLRVIEYRRNAAKGMAKQEAIETGSRESQQVGVQTLLDVTHQLGSPRTSSSPINYLGFSELVDTSVTRREETWGRGLQNLQTPNFGLSPHAPYTTTPALVTEAAQKCRDAQRPIMMHLAESPEEITWLQTGRGPMQDFLESVVGAELASRPHPDQLAGYIRLLAESPLAFIVHGNFLDDAAVEALVQHRQRMALVYCPRTHAHFQHARYPLESYLRQGLTVILGTDSRASNPDLSILEEARFVRRHYPSIKAEEILKTITVQPAQLLRSVTKLRQAWTLVPCDAKHPKDVLESLLEDSRPPIPLDLPR